MKGLIQRRFFRPAAVAGVALLHCLAMLSKPLGSVSDESLYLLLAKNLRHGAFAFPDPLGVPVTDPLPGLSLLLTLPVWLLEPHWMAIRAGALAVLGAGLYGAWSLARKALPGPWAAGVFLLIAVNASLASQAGLVLAEIPLMALSLALFRLSAESYSRRNFLLLAFGAALAALIRPHGAILAVCLGLGVWWRAGARKGAAFGVIALAPLGIWLIRNNLLARTLTHYGGNWRVQMPLLWEPWLQVGHAGRVLRVIIGEGVLGVSHPALQTAAGGLLLTLALYGAVILLKDGKTWAFPMAANVVLVLSLHLTWLEVSTRYAVALVPLVWILAAAGARPWLEDRRRLAVFLAFLLGGISLRGSLPHASGGLHGPPPVVQEGAYRWIRRNTAAPERFESLTPATLTLMTGRPAYLPPPVVLREAWLAGLIKNGVRYVEVKTIPIGSDGFLSPAAQYIVANHARWSSVTPYLIEVFRSPVESTVIFRVEHPAPGKFLEAWEDFLEAASILDAAPPARRHASTSREKVRALLEAALVGEPDLSCARDLLKRMAATP